MDGRNIGVNASWIQPTSIGGLGIVLSSVAVSAASSRVLAESIRIRWTIGTHYGPEHAPTVAVLAAFPAILAGMYGGSRWLRKRVDRGDRIAEVWVVYELVVLVALGTICAAQLGIIALNL